MERFVYNSSDAVTTIDKVFYNTIVTRFNQPEKLKVIPNFVDIQLFKPVEASPELLNDEIFPAKSDILKMMYAGNLGHAQDWVPLIELAKALRNEKIEFWIIGEGVMKEFLEQEVAKYSLSNIHIVPYQNRELMPVLIAYADLHFIFMSPEMEGQGFPSKVYSILACAKPIMVISGSYTPIFNFLEPLNCAYLITDRSQELQLEKMLEITGRLLVDKSELTSMGRSGFDHIQENYSKDIITMKYVSLLDSLLVK
jgi:glycosyltransferase involved in cell wall biosynthesis